MSFMIGFPKPGKKTKKITRDTDPSYVAWIHGYACVVCGNWPVHGHHVKSKGVGGSDKTCLPLCHHHHTGDQGIHNIGKIHFQALFRVNLEALVKQYNTLYNDGAKGPHSHKIPHVNVVSS